MLTRVISLDAYIDRMKFIPEEMAKMGWEYERFSAVDPYPNAGAYIGSSYSHTEVLRDISGLLLVCEDDVMFIDGAKEIYDKAFAQLPEDWDLFYLGGNVKKPAQRYSENLFRITYGVHCTHAILYREKARNFILENFNALVDDRTGEITFFDHWLYCNGLGKMNCYICYPVIAYQRPNYSNARKDIMDYMGEMKENEKKHLI
jgi:GR25 family glycosyltransferase involved in LPS biosynthesis